MIDMLVRLYALPPSGDLYAKMDEEGMILRRPGTYERHAVVDWVRERFSAAWASEVEVAFARQPVSCFIATRERKVLGFACFNTTARGFFGPAGVAEEVRNTGIGTALLFKSLEALRADGYAYAIVGRVGPREFYEKACGAVEIPGSNPGIYDDRLTASD